MMQVATTNVIKEYFPGRQIGPFGAFCLTMNTSAMVVPQVWKAFMETLGWKYNLIAIGRYMSIFMALWLSRG